MMKCCNCGKGPNETDAILIRVNPKGEVGVFKCSPHCEAKLSYEEKVKLALFLEDKK